MIEPIVASNNYYEYLPGINRIIHTIKRHFEYKIGNNVDTIEQHVISLYDKQGQVKEHNVSHRIDKLA